MDADTNLVEALRAWRLERSRTDGVPAFVVADNKTLQAIAVASPTNTTELLQVPGIGPSRLARYGDDILRVLAGDGPAMVSEEAEGTPGLESADPSLLEALRAWRIKRARTDGVPAFVVAANKTLLAIAVARPGNAAELLQVPGIGPARLERYGDQILEVILGAW